jgi:rare lipoprotein A
MPRFSGSLGALAIATACLSACVGPPSLPPPTEIAVPVTLPTIAPSVYPSRVPSFLQVGVASWYGNRFKHKLTANGERYDPEAITAAHRTLPLDTVAHVTNLRNGRSVMVRINDRGPYAQERVIDLSRAAARLLGMKEQGVARVRIEVYAADQTRTAKAAFSYRN